MISYTEKKILLLQFDYWKNNLDIWFNHNTIEWTIIKNNLYLCAAVTYTLINTTAFFLSMVTKIITKYNNG